jgi:EpsI family protein
VLERRIKVPRQLSARYLVTLALFAAAVGAAKLSEARAPQPLTHPLATIPGYIGDWTSAGDQRLEEEVISTLKASEYMLRQYRRGSAALTAFVAFYASQRAGVSMHSPKNCLPGAGWESLEQGVIAVNVAGRPVSINRYVVQKNGTRAVVLYWYQTRDRIVASEYTGKLFLIWDRIRGGSPASSFVRIVIPETGREALDDGLAFASRLIPAVAHSFSGVRGST